MREAHDTAVYGKGEPKARYQDAEAKLTEAKQLASSFGQDTHPVEVQFAELRRLTAPRTAPAAPAASAVVQAAPPPMPPALSLGQMLLEKARLELKKGETSTARRMAETALTSSPEVKEEALALLRTLDAEDFKQKRLQTMHGFDAAQSAYVRGEYAQATALIAALDTKLLDADRLVRLREMSMTPAMMAASNAASADKNVAVVNAAAPPPSTGAAGSTILRTGGVMPGQSAGSGVVMAGAVGKATATDAVDGGQLDAYKQRQKILMDSLRQQGLDAQRDANEKFRTGQHDEALQLLEDHLAMLREQKLEAGQLALLRRPVESKLSHFRLLKAQSDLTAGSLAGRKLGQERVDASRKAEEMKRQNVDRLMKEFNGLFKEGKYLEAENIAMKVSELDPDNGVAAAAIYMAREQRRVNEYRDIKDGREDWALRSASTTPSARDRPRSSRTARNTTRSAGRRPRRKPLSPIKLGRPTEKEKMIQRRLSVPVSVSFDGAPLKSVINELRDINGINIDIDDPALQEAGISLESPITIKLDGVSLKSALNLILHKVHLTHVIKDEVLLITTENQARGKLVAVTYQVADLVIPVENFGDVRTPPKPLYSPGQQNLGAAPTPVTPGPTP